MFAGSLNTESHNEEFENVWNILFFVQKTAVQRLTVGSWVGMWIKLSIYFIGLFPKTNSQQVRFTLKHLIQDNHHAYHSIKD